MGVGLVVRQGDGLTVVLRLTGPLQLIVLFRRGVVCMRSR